MSSHDASVNPKHVHLHKRRNLLIAGLIGVVLVSIGLVAAILWRNAETVAKRFRTQETSLRAATEAKVSQVATALQAVNTAQPVSIDKAVTELIGLQKYFTDIKPLSLGQAPLGSTLSAAYRDAEQRTDVDAKRITNDITATIAYIEYNRVLASIFSDAALTSAIKDKEQATAFHAAWKSAEDKLKAVATTPNTLKAAHSTLATDVTNIANYTAGLAAMYEKKDEAAVKKIKTELEALLAKVRADADLIAEAGTGLDVALTNSLLFN